MKSFKWKEFEHRFDDNGDYIGFFKNKILQRDQSDMLNGLNLSETTSGIFFKDSTTLEERLKKAGFVPQN